jgi:hypothetical protein
MNTRTEGIIVLILALFVLISAMWDARISITVSICVLLGLGVYKLFQKVR